MTILVGNNTTPLEHIIADSTSLLRSGNHNGAKETKCQNYDNLVGLVPCATTSFKYAHKT